ncbi:MAG: leucine-rich repeat protein, partial [Alkalibacterium sp.]|nr:leucine-rich repeat protein [Alkalibacterium sp.]
MIKRHKRTRISNWFQNSKGFTLIELIVVMAIIGILVLLAMPRFVGQTRQARLTQIIHDIVRAETKVDEYLVRHESLDGWTSIVSSMELNEWADDGELYNREGVVDSDVTSGDYNKLPQDFVKRTVNSALDGAFYSDQEGNVYYHGENGGQSNPNGNDTHEEAEWLPEPEVPEDFDVTTNWNRVPDGSDGDYPEWTEQDLFEYEIVNGDYARVTGYYGANPASDVREELDVVIPEYISDGGQEYPVRVIGELAFSIIGDGSGVESVDSGHPSSYVALNTVHIPNTVLEIESYAFLASETTQIEEALYLGKNIEHIGEMAFASAGFSRLVTTESLVSLGRGVFGYGYRNELDDVNMYYSKQLKELSDGLFQTGLAHDGPSTVTLPPNLEVINYGSLVGLRTKEIIVPETVHTFADWSFDGLEELDIMHIKDINKVTFLDYDGNPYTGEDIIELGVKGLTNFRDYPVDKGLVRFDQPFLFDEATQTITGYWHEGHGDTIVIPEFINGIKVRHIADGAFYRFRIFKHTGNSLSTSVVDRVVIPETIESIGASAFTDYYTQQQYKNGFEFRGDKVTRIEAETFHSIATDHLRLPNSIEYIHPSAFENASILTVNIPHKLVEINPAMFIQSSPDRIRLEQVILTDANDKLEVIGASAFQNTSIDEVY